jgi:hypothetical protein
MIIKIYLQRWNKNPTSHIKLKQAEMMKLKIILQMIRDHL